MANQCHGKVAPRGLGGSLNMRPCHRRAKVQKDELWYCSIHDPEYLNAKDTEAQKKRDDRFKGRLAYLHGNELLVLLEKMLPDYELFCVNGRDTRFEEVRYCIQNVTEAKELIGKCKRLTT